MHSIITTALETGAKFIGTDYSRGNARYNLWPDGAADCSSFTYAIWAAAGFPLLDASGNELLTSTYQVNAVGFELVYPSTRAEIGKLPSPKGLLSSYGAQPGDMVFWCFDKSTTRKNKITHVGNIDIDGKQILHTANNNEKCCRKPLSYGDGSICAIIRKTNFERPELHPIKRPTDSSARPEEWMVRMAQIALNVQRREKLVADGLFGPKLEAAVVRYNYDVLGIESTTITLETWAALGFAATQKAPEPAPVAGPVVLKITTPYMRPDGLAQLQDGWGRMGYDCGTPDGIFGEKTKKGMQAFIAANKED